MFDPEEDELIARLRSKAQEWRDRAFTSQHMSQLKSDTLEACARELDDELTRRTQT
jgi:hypothetical protein